jgi:hypothetical protein
MGHGFTALNSSAEAQSIKSAEAETSTTRSSHKVQTDSCAVAESRLRAELTGRSALGTAAGGAPHSGRHILPLRQRSPPPLVSLRSSVLA